ncbi:MAG TPA: hypothetical protein VHA56_15700 [Mucilaginibacter sp.]|nr:hypothetical protein [Mucilaginibacter sp.]
MIFHAISKFLTAPLKCLLVLLTGFVLFPGLASGQAELEPWGNIAGIRKQGQLFSFESSVRVVSTDRQHVSSTAKEKQQPHYKRINEDEQEVTTNIGDLFITENVKDEGSGKIGLTINVNAHADTVLQGVYLCITLPDQFLSGELRYKGGDKGEYDHFVKAANHEFDDNADEITFVSQAGELNLKTAERSLIMVRTDSSSAAKKLLLFVPVNLGGMKKGEVAEKQFRIKISGDIDKSAVNLTLNTHRQGRAFDGLGGNFRLQNPVTDPQVIDYCLKNLRVAWGRVEMPWRFWQPDIGADAQTLADSAKLNPAVKNAIAMARRLDSLRIPIILSAWFSPQWAVEGKLNFQPVNGVWGNQLNEDNMQAIYKSIADYISFLKDRYGVQVKLFSFNESDLGINVRLTPEQHAAFIKGCGAYFAARGLQTKMLLGDNSDANSYAFIYPALNDPGARQYIGAISFHSWRGWETPTLQKWADAASELGVPLIVGEGSIDADAWRYPDIFQEQTYALKEINLYTRLLAICQPESILQWQLTADYSPLIGGGIFGNNEPLRPGQRFWNLKQLSITPKGLFAMPLSGIHKDISCAALGDNAQNRYTVHLVNNGAKRKVILSGLPDGVKKLDIYVTNKNDYMKHSSVKVKDGTVSFKLQDESFTTLISE